MTTLTALVETTETDVLRLPCGALRRSEEIGADMMVVRREFPADADIEAVKAGQATAETVVLTSDGRGWIEQWHRAEDGAEDCDLVYVEEYDSAGRAWHGWIDPVSRKIVQEG